MNLLLKKAKDAIARFGARISWKTHLPWCAGLLVVVLILFGKYIVSTTEVLSMPGTDVYSYYLHSQTFTSTEICNGNLPAWNPFTYGGHPYLADFQSALLYPPTWFFALLNPVMALNWWVAFHVFLFGFLTYAWTASRGMRPASSFVAGAAAMLGGAFFMHVYAGHISNLGSMAWAPLVFMGIDGWFRRKHSGWIVLAAAGAALQVYAGHPQYVYYTAIAAGIYSIANLIGIGRDWKKMLLGVIVIYPLATLLSLAQLLPGYLALGETVRAGGSAYNFASIFGFSPENLLTLIAPWAYGGTTEVAYWGRCYLWEMQMFIGIGVLVLAIWGFAGQKRSHAMRMGAVLLVLLLIAVGANIEPLYKLLFNYLPFFSSFRGTSKFIYIISLFLAMLAGAGMERLFAREKRATTAGIITLVCGLVVVLVGVLIQTGALADTWKLIYGTVTTASGDDVYFKGNPMRASQEFQQSALALTGSQLWAGGLWLMLFGALLLAVDRVKQAVWAIGALAVINVGIFAWKNTTGFEASAAFMEPLNKVLTENRGDYRTLNMIQSSANMAWRKDGMWGTDPSVLKRYAEYLFFSQGRDPGEATQYLSFNRMSPLLNMLRCRFAFAQDNTGAVKLIDMGEPLPRFAILSQYKVIKDRDEIFKTIATPGFQPKQQVILESQPNPMPENDNVTWTLRVLAATSDSWQLEISCDKATLLVMTDPYAKGWKARPLTQMGQGVVSVQTNYDILPANYCMRAIPLAAGRHQIRLDYEPPGLGLGVKISLLTTLLVALAILLPAFRRKLCFAD